jgi:hypothetical protein
VSARRAVGVTVTAYFPRAPLIFDTFRSLGQEQRFRLPLGTHASADDLKRPEGKQGRHAAAAEDPAGETVDDVLFSC